MPDPDSERTLPIRAFVAVSVEPSHGLRKALDALAALGSAVKPVAAAQLHITLKFLGDVEDSRLDHVRAALARVAAGEPPFEFAVRGLGAFPTIARPTVIWAGVERGDPLKRLAGALDAALSPLGFPVESRPFTPHLTLARVKARPPAALTALFDRFRDAAFQTVSAASVELFRSDLGRDGPVYTRLDAAKLASV